MAIRRQAFIVVPSVICTLGCVFGFIGYIIGHLLGLPDRLGLPLWARIFGCCVLLAGSALMGWIFKYRKPVDVVVSTYMTMRKIVTCRLAAENSASTEPLIVEGPHRHVRNPMYFAVVVMLFGWWLVLDRTFLLFMAFLFTLWFNLVVIRFEESELRTIFGNEYDMYAKSVPRFIPSLKRRW